MLNQIVGQVDWPATFVLIAIFMGIGIPITILVGNHKTKEDYELQKMQLQNSHNEVQYKQETWRAAEMKKIEQNLITSHRETE